MGIGEGSEANNQQASSISYLEQTVQRGMDQLFGMVQPAGSPAAAAPHAAYKIPSGDGPYARAKHFQVYRTLI